MCHLKLVSVQCNASQLSWSSLRPYQGIISHGAMGSLHRSLNLSHKQALFRVGCAQGEGSFHVLKITKADESLHSWQVAPKFGLFHQASRIAFCHKRLCGMEQQQSRLKILARQGTEDTAHLIRLPWLHTMLQGGDGQKGQDCCGVLPKMLIDERRLTRLNAQWKNGMTAQDTNVLKEHQDIADGVPGLEASAYHAFPNAIFLARPGTYIHCAQTLCCILADPGACSQPQMELRD